MTLFIPKESPAVYIKAETRRKEKSIKKIATNFQEHLKTQMMVMEAAAYSIS